MVNCLAQGHLNIRLWKRENTTCSFSPSRCWECQGFVPITFQSWTYFYQLWATTGTRNLSAITVSWRCVSQNFKQEKKKMLNFSLSCGEFNLFVTENSLADSFWQGKCLICSWRKGSSSFLMDCNKLEVVKGLFPLATGWRCSTCLKWLIYLLTSLGDEGQT